MKEASALQRHYVTGEGEELEIDSEVYETSTIVQYAMGVMKGAIIADLSNAGQIRNGGEIWSTDVLGSKDFGDRNRLGQIIDDGVLLAEQDNKRLKYANNRFVLKSFSEVRESETPEGNSRSVHVRWRVDDVWDFASFQEQKEMGTKHTTVIPLPNEAQLRLPDGLSEYMTQQDCATEFAYFAEWEEKWQIQ